MQHKDKLLEILRQKYDNLKKCWSQNMAANMKLKNENKMLRTITKVCEISKNRHFLLMEQICFSDITTTVGLQCWTVLPQHQV